METIRLLNPWLIPLKLGCIEGFSAYPIPTQADSDSGFLIDKIAIDTYKAVISFVGYRTKMLDKLVITAEKQFAELKQIQLSPDSRSLKQVDVVGQKTLVEDRAKKIVMTMAKGAGHKRDERC